MANSITQPVRRLRRKLTFAIWLGRSARQGAALLAILGSAILVGRVAFDLPLEQASWFLLPLAVVPFTAWRGVERRVPSRGGAAAWLDLHSGGRGHLLIDFEQEDERWSAAVTRELDRLPEFPALALGSFARPLLPALAFAALALFIPLSHAAPGPSTSFFENAIEGLREQFETLDEVVDLDETVAEELEKRLTDLAENIDAEEPEAMLEAIDSLREHLGLEGQQAAELAQNLFERFGKMGEEALGDSGLAQKLMGAKLEELLESGLAGDFLKNMEALTPELGDLATALAGNQLQLPEGFELDPAQMQKLSRLLRSELRKSIGELQLAGLVDLSELKLSGDGSSLSELLASLHRCDESCKKPGGT